MEGLKDQNTEEKDQNKLIKWLKRLGWAGFLFFTIKGLVWLAIFFGLGTLIKDWFGF